MSALILISYLSYHCRWFTISVTILTILVSFDMPSPQNRPVDVLNTYLVSRDVCPVRTQLQTSWQKASRWTEGNYTQKVGQAVAVVVKDITPQALCLAHFGPQTCCIVSSLVTKMLIRRPWRHLQSVSSTPWSDKISLYGSQTALPMEEALKYSQ